MMRVHSAEDRLAEAVIELLGRKSGGGSGVGYKHDATGTPTTTYAHGPGGVFSFPGVNPDVFSAMLGIESGLIGRLPKLPSVYTNPVFQTITGVQSDVGSEPDGVCDPAVVAGLLKACKLTSVFGRYRRQTREVYLNRLGQRTDNADPMNLRLVNRYGGGGDVIMNPQGTSGMDSVLEMEWAKVLFEFGVSVNRLLARQMFEGNPSNNTGGEGYKEMTGLDILIGTGHQDAETGALCAALDSDIKNFNFQNVGDFANGTDIVEVLTYLYRYVRSIARRSGLLPTEWAFVMREELFYELTAIWPVTYLTTRGQVRDADWQRGTFDLGAATRDRDQMRREAYLMIDGVRVEVILDDGITELTNVTDSHVNPGCFASDVYLVPLTVLGGTPVTYMEYFDHDNGNIRDALQSLRLDREVWTSNAGAWMWSKERTRLCVFAEGKVEPRMILRTPQLAGRVMNVQYCPLQHTRSAFPDAPYFANGGVTSRSGPSYFQDWQ